MLLSPEQARVLLLEVDPGRLHHGRPVGLRDGALLALAAVGLSSVELAGLRASAITMAGGRVVVTVRRRSGNWSRVLPTDLAARLLAWLSENRLWADAEHVFRGSGAPLTATGIRKILWRYRNRISVPARRGRP